MKKWFRMDHRSTYVLMVRRSVIFFAIQISVFSVFTIMYTISMRQNQLRDTETMLNTLSQNFTKEYQRLDSFFTLCTSSDPSIVLTISSNSNGEIFNAYAPTAVEKLRLIKQSLPYVSNLLMYASDGNIIVSNRGAYDQAERFLMKNFDFAPDTSHDFLLSQNGLNYIGNSLFYVKRLYSYGFIAAQINMKSFSNISSSINSDISFFITNSNNDFIIQNGDITIEDLLAKEKSLSNRFLFPGSIVLSKAISPQFTGYIINENKSYIKVRNYFIIIIASSLLILIGSFLLLILNNLRTMKPLTLISKSLGYKENQNEIRFLENKISSLLTEFSELSAKVKHPTPFAEKAYLQYLLQGGSVSLRSEMEFLYEKYQDFSIFYFCIQDKDGGGSYEIMNEISRNVTDENHCFFISLNDQSAVIVLQKTVYDELLVKLSGIFHSHADFYAYISIFKYCNALEAIHEYYTQAVQYLWYCNVNRLDNVSLVDEVKVQSPESHTALRTFRIDQDTVFHFLNRASLNSFRDYLDSIFMAEEEIPLKQLTVYYSHLVMLLSNYAQLHKLELHVTVFTEHLYHPEYMVNTLCGYFEELSSRCQSKSGKVFDSILQYLNDNYTKDLSLDSVADTFKINPVYLSSLFKKATGENFSFYIMKLRMKEAARIIEQNQDVKGYEIATKLGFCNSATFIRQFKKFYGVTPAQFRSKTITSVVSQEEKFINS